MSNYEKEFTITEMPYSRLAESAKLTVGNGSTLTVQVNQSKDSEARVSWGGTLSGATPEQARKVAEMFTKASKLAEDWTANGYGGNR